MRIWTLCCLLLLGGCNNLAFSTQVSPNIGELAVSANRASQVVEYSVEEIHRHDSDALGELVSSYCQRDLSYPKPSQTLLRRDLKYQTQERGGNGFVIMECSASPFRGCSAYLECRALAYRVAFD